MHLLVFMFFLLISTVSLHADYVGNVHDGTGLYRSFEFTAKGNPIRPISPLLAPHSAWPSAVDRDGVRRVFVSEYVNGIWSRIRRYTSTNGAPYIDAGVVFEADSSEPYGIGPSDVTFDGTTWRMFYLVRGSDGPGPSIGLATSSDGVNFTRYGVVYTAGTAAPGGLSLAYACSDNGDHYLLLHAYSSDLATANSFIASASQVSGPYAFSDVTLTPTSSSGTITGTAGNNFAAFTGSIDEGRPIVVDGSGGVERYFVTEISGSVLYLDRPIAADYASTPFADAFARKVELSFVRKTATGWKGAATGYGPMPGAFAEYTGPVSAPSIMGPWEHGNGFFLIPYFNSGRISTENPSPVRSHSNCGD